MSNLPDLPVDPVGVDSSVTFAYGDKVCLFIGHADDDNGTLYLLDREAVETIAANLLSTLVDFGVDILSDDAAL